MIVLCPLQHCGTKFNMVICSHTFSSVSAALIRFQGVCGGFSSDTRILGEDFFNESISPPEHFPPSF